MIFAKTYHVPVLLKDSVAYLKVEKDKRYIDATLGGGGHTEAILQGGGIVLGLDQDQEAIDFVSQKYKIQNTKYKIHRDLFIARGNFRDIKSIAQKYGFLNVAGIVFDLGLSSHQLDVENCGFSYRRNEPLDMRMDKSASLTAEEVVNKYSEGELYEIFTKFTEELNSRAIARAIVRARSLKPITTTEGLMRIIAGLQQVSAVGNKLNKTYSRIFQGLRIEVNRELDNLREGLEEGIKLLGVHGRMVILSYHSLEDRLVKNYFKNKEQEMKGKIITRKAVKPGYEEIHKNPRSKSAKLRVFESL